MVNGIDPLWIKTNFGYLYAALIFNNSIANRLVNTHKALYWVLLRLTHEHSCGCCYNINYIATVMVSCFNVLWMAILPDNGGLLAETCSRDINCTIFMCCFCK